MEAIREIVEIKSQQLQFTLPANFNEQRVEMILLPLSKENNKRKKNTFKNVKGALSKYANSVLLEQEGTAWADAVEGKYATH